MAARNWTKNRKPRPFRRRLEQLEDRLAPATVHWDGGPTGNGTDWLTASNWVGDVLPDAADDVVIGSTGSNPGIVLGGTATVNSAQITRSLSVGGTLSITEQSTIDSAFSLTGTISGAAELTVNGPFATSGYISNPRIDAYGGLTLLGGRLFGGRLVNHGVANAPLGDGLRLHAGAVLENRGTLTLADTAIDREPGDSPTMQLVNSGLITKPSGGAWATIGVPLVSTGTITVGSGELDIYPDVAGGTVISGPVNMAAGTSLVFRGPLSMSGDLNAAGATVSFIGSAAQAISGSYETAETIARSNLQLTGTIAGLGKLYVDGSITLSPTSGPTTLTLSQLDNHGTGGIFGTASLAVTGPTVTGGRIYVPSVDAYGGLTILGGRIFGTELVNHGIATAHDFVLHDGAHLNNHGTFALLTGGIDIQNGASISNGPSAVFSLQTDASVGRSGACIVFTNQGLLTKENSSGVTTLYAHLINSGTVRVETGQLNVHCGISQPAGSTGTVSGNVNAPVSNGGHMAVTPSPTPLTIAGYTQSPLGSLIEVIGGPAPGTQYGQIVVNGNVALDGTLQVQLINGFTPVLGDEFTVIVNNGCNAVDGSFIGLPEWTPGGPLVYSGFIGFGVSYQGGDGNDVVLTVRQVARPTNTTADVSMSSPLFGVDSITLTATVTAGNGTPTGSVNFYAGTTLLGTAPLIDGVATLPLSSTTLAVDSHTIRAEYTGNGGFLASEATVDVIVLAPSTFQGLVYVDFNNDGEVNFGELAIPGVTITLTGFDDLGQPVNVVTQTDSDGIYTYVNLRPSNAAGYTITQSHPAGYIDGIDSLGLVDGASRGLAGNDVFTCVKLDPGSYAENYNFGERPANGGTVGAGQTATIGFWQNKNGQNLIKALNGGATATQLGHWLAVTFPNMYGMLDGLTNAQVAAHYKTLFGRNGQTSPGGPSKVDAQIMATALAIYVTNQTLAGTTAVSYGFQVTQYGVGAATFNVGTNGAAFGVANGTFVSVMDLLLAVNARSWNGLLFDQNGDGVISPEEAGLRALANNVFSLINESGGI